MIVACGTLTSVLALALPRPARAPAPVRASVAA